MSNDRPSEAEEDLGNEAEHSIHESLADLSAHSLGDSIDLVRAAQDGLIASLASTISRARRSTSISNCVPKPRCR